MRAWLMDSYEGVERLRLEEVPDPRPGPDQVLLNVRFAGLNPADAFLASGMYPAKPPLPHVLGRDGVGDVGQSISPRMCNGDCGICNQIHCAIMGCRPIPAAWLECCERKLAGSWQKKTVGAIVRQDARECTVIVL